MIIGAWIDKGTGLAFNGSLDEVQVFNRTLSATEVLRMYLDYQITQNISFNSPTMNNNSHTENKTLYLNVTASTPSIKNFRFYYDSSEYKIYDSDVKLLLNFDNNTAIGENATTVKDISFNNYSGSIAGGSSYVSGLYGNALYFPNNESSTNDYRVDLTPPNITGSSPFTVCLRFKYDSDQIVNSTYIPTPIRYLFGNTAGTDTGAIYFNTGYGFRFNFRNSSGSDFPVDTPTRTYAENWYHICGTWNTTYTTMYLDGVQGTGRETYGNSLDSGSSLAQIGGNRFKGTIDYIKVFNKSLTPEEVQMEYNSAFKKTGDYSYEFSGEKYIQII